MLQYHCPCRHVFHSQHRNCHTRCVKIIRVSFYSQAIVIVPLFAFCFHLQVNSHITSLSQESDGMGDVSDSADQSESEAEDKLSPAKKLSTVHD